LQAEERERNAIGQELHDNVNQILASAKLYLSMAETDEELRETLIRNSMKYIEDAIQEIRSLSKSQVTPLKIINLQELVEDLLNEFDQKADIRTNFNYNVSNNLVVEEDLKLNIYRVIQEQLNNVLKHSAAEKVSVSVEGTNGWLNVKIADDGKGFSMDKRRNGIGISNMTNRVESYNGQIIIDTSPGKGCVVDVKIPV
jgi:signal transduction histidine kinase